jgi:hypothetical protein
MGGVVKRKRLSADSERDDPLKECGKDAFGLEALTRSHFPALRRLIELYPPKSAQESIAECVGRSQAIDKASLSKSAIYHSFTIDSHQVCMLLLCGPMKCDERHQASPIHRVMLSPSSMPANSP